MKMTVKEAFEKVLADLEAMSPEQLRAELEKHRDGEIAVAMRETQVFMADLAVTDPELFKRATGVQE